jgi:hypothetical protein
LRFAVSAIAAKPIVDAGASTGTLQ